MKHNALSPVAASDDLDGQLTAFYRNEMPNPWPVFKAPITIEAFPATARRPNSRWLAFRPRLAVAASIGLLLIGGALLPTSLSVPGRPNLPDTGEATKKPLPNPDAPKPEMLNEWNGSILE
jgi:hypothetical protein